MNIEPAFDAASGADIIVTLATDGQRDPVEIPKLTAPILTGEADVVNGTRYVNGNSKNTSGTGGWVRPCWIRPPT